MFMDVMKIKKAAFEKKCGLSNGYINSIKDNIGTGKLDAILTTFPELSRDWLLTGQGEMLKGETNSSSQAPSYGTIPLLPISAQGGTLNDYVVSVRESECERITSPIKGVDFAITVSGESMSPEYPSGSYIFLKKIDECKFIEWGRVYVLDTRNGTVVKKIMPSEKEGSVRCVSINPEYPPFDVAMGDIIGMYRVLLSMTLK